MAVEHAPVEKRGLPGSYPQIGVPLGLILATSMYLLTTNMDEDTFQAWGWRNLPVPIVLIVVGTHLPCRRGVPCLHPDAGTRQGPPR